MIAMDFIADVAKFHRACDVPIRHRPAWPSDERIRLRWDLIYEEHYELEIAIARRDFASTADAIADLIYVLVGTALEFGIPLAEVWSEVQRANMAKVDPATGKVLRRADGKILKPDGWTPPDIAGVMRAKITEELETENDRLRRALAAAGVVRGSDPTLPDVAVERGEVER